ncbi:phosphatidylethanolamine/phosphatidyl-N-methylethanolamine N-methyltransferase [Paenibacillus sp. PastF-1]|nr:phosphatidylethanolamine/phosphatidyl-N-methylethanolamine N-methyltransferase [Paenibacillus sp. PastF-2]MDF9851986.1 phosphatidylethanolamine/phosphatidyl-N-methylethanolamine N-methyltransferase [Paenibacillus sp. PastM-2]MDF9858529.1 phosphatidylethanolamine/phosphatidyl-N-methylethanolamine N-methyltransferase [Paenibacillus sp. PastF-1]MDH6483795.1 phosphatidylethanolamine/phosphatidyl-N-methylethanolamine N-methyltransferase [Paenibacillus sp. PastH-2]MDH6511182.1 phosphatidylethanola
MIVKGDVKHQVMKNSWNKVIYRFWAPFYDYFFNSGPFFRARKQIFENLDIKARSNTLFVGVGTGADLQFITDKDISVTAIDLSAEMLDKARKKYESQNFTFKEMDAQNLSFPSESFDVVIANLILSVVPDPDQCIQEMIRVTRTEGSIVIFDKFAPSSRGLPIIKKLIRPIIATMGTDIGRKFEQILQPYEDNIRVEEDMSVLFNGMYRKIKLRKIKG